MTRTELPLIEDRRTADADGHDRIDPPGVAIVTVSSSRGAATEDDSSDPGGDAIAEILADAGHVITARRTVPDDYVRIKTVVSECLDRLDVDVVITTAGRHRRRHHSGRGRRTLRPRTAGVRQNVSVDFLEKVRTRVVSTHAMAGIARDVPMSVLPGSENAVRLVTREIIIKEAPHLTGLATRHVSGSEDG